MPRFIATVQPGSLPDSVARAIKEIDFLKIKIINTAPTRSSKRTGGFIFLECPYELVEVIRNADISGFRDIEEDIRPRVAGSPL